MRCYTFLIDEYPHSREFLLTSLFIYRNTIIMVVDQYSSLTYEHLVLESDLSTCFLVCLPFIEQ